MPSIRSLRPKKPAEPAPAPRVLDYYQILGVERGASEAEITQAFRQLVAQCDVDPNYSPSAPPQRHLATLSTAYSVLVDPAKRLRYDRMLDERQEGSRQSAEGSRQEEVASSVPQVSPVPRVPPVPSVPRRQAAAGSRPSKREGPLAAKAKRLAPTRILGRPATASAARHGHAPIPHPGSPWRERIKETGKHSLWWGLSLLIHGCAIWITANWNIRMAVVERPVSSGKIDISRLIEEVKVTLPELPHDTGVPGGGSMGDDPPLETPQPPQPMPLEADLKFDPKKIEMTAVIGPEVPSAYARRPALSGGKRSGGPGLGPGDGPGVDGGDEVSVSSVLAGLRWLHAKQLSTGAWKADREEARWADPGLTGLALLAFEGHGFTHTKGEYQLTVRRGLAYLKSVQDAEGCLAFRAYQDGGNFKRIGGYMYCHAIGTLALTEAYGMTKDPMLRERTERAVDFIIKTQNSTGGWRYYSNSPDADSSVSGWMVMALHSATLSGVEVPQKVFDGARRFFDSVTDKEMGATSYMPGQPPSSAALIAVGLLCHQYLGMKPDDPYIDMASAAINKFPPTWFDVVPGEIMSLENLPVSHPGANDYYFWYYANLALHQRRGEAWEKWHPQVKRVLTEKQVRTGPDAGSWPPLDRWSLRGGRVYSTALATLCLEVYYRYAPIYRQVTDPVLAAFGEAWTAYDKYAEVAPQKDEAAAKARATAQEKLEGFLKLTDPKPSAKPDEPTRKRRGEAAKMLIACYRFAGENDKAISVLTDIPVRFPGILADTERTLVLAACLRARAQAEASAGKADESRRTLAQATELYFSVFKTAPELNPGMAYATAHRLFLAEEWQKARELYEAQAARLPKKLDPKTATGERAAYIFHQIATCYTKLGLYSNAVDWLKRCEGVVVGPSLSLLRERADLERTQKQFAGARSIYEDIMKRVPRRSADWWQAKADQLEMLLREGNRAEVVSEVDKLDLFNPDLGGPQFKRRFLDLRRQAQAGS